MSMLQEEEQTEIPEWVVTFGDMMSLLLTFFVLLFSMSEIKKEDSQAMLESLRRQFGHDKTPFSPVPGRASSMNSALSKLASLGRARRANTMNGGDKVRAPVGSHPRVWAIRPAEDSTIGGVVRFQEGSGKLSTEDEQTLREAADVIGGKPQKIEIRGHTSARPLPPDSPYRNHWDLAYARCFHTMEYLVGLGIDPKRIRIAVAADNEPAHISPDPALRQQNARVEILMLDELTEDLEGTREEKQQRYSTEAKP